MPDNSQIINSLNSNNIENGYFEDNEDTGFDLGRTLTQLTTGFFEGLTTLPVSDWIGSKPRNTVEKIANSIGGLLGFIGLLPGPGIVGRVALGSTLKGVGIAGEVGSTLAKMPSVFRFTSVPMGIANVTMKGLEKAGFKSALEATSFLRSSPLIKNAIEGGLHLGIASAVGAAPIYDITPETFIDRRLEGFKSGALYGIGNAMIGNMFARGGKFDLGSDYVGMKPNEILELSKTNPTKAAEILKSADKVNKIARVVSSSLAFGLPSTIQNQPLELQIYEYLLNGYFGGKELSWQQKKALELMKPYAESPTFRSMLLRPEEKIPNYSTLDPEIQNELKMNAQFELGGILGRFSQSEYAVYGSIEDALSKLNKDFEDGKISSAYQTEVKNALRIKKAIDDKVIELGNESGTETAIEEVTKEIADEASKEYEQVKSIMELTNMFNNILKASGEANKVNDLESFMPQFQDLENYYKEKGLGYYKNIFVDIAREVIKAKGTESSKESLLEEFDLQKKLIDIGNEYLVKGKMLNQNDFKVKVAEEFGINLQNNEKLDLSLNKAYLRLKSSIPRAEYVVTKDGKFVDPPETRMSGSKWVTSIEPQPVMVDIIGNSFREIKTYIDKGKEIPIHQAIEDKSIKNITTISLIENLYKENKAFYGGKKADANLFTGDFLITKDEVPSIIEAVTNSTAKNKLGLFSVQYSKAKERYIRNGGSEETFNHLFANNIEFVRRFNFRHITDYNEVLKELTDGHFITDPTSLNKRFQLFGAYEPRVSTPDLLEQNPDLPERARYIILNALNKDGSFHGEFDKLFTYKTKEGEEKFEEKFEAQLDDGTLVRFDKFFVYKTKEGKKKFQVQLDDGTFVSFDKFSAYKTKKNTEDKVSSFTWGRTSSNSYEVSSQGDKRFSAFNARIKSKGNKSIEELYQTEVKGYKTVAEGKGKRPLDKEKTQEQTYQEYKDLWKLWADENPDLINELSEKAKGKVLTDKFANTNTNQARALAEILSEKKSNALIVEKRFEAQLDGGIFVRRKVYEALAKHAGLDPLSGSMKGIAMQQGELDGLGGLLSKHALHKADEAMDAWMEKNGKDFIMFDTTAKQRGKRKSYDWSFKDNEITLNGQTNVSNETIPLTDYETIKSENVKKVRGYNDLIKILETKDGKTYYKEIYSKRIGDKDSPFFYAKNNNKFVVYHKSGMQVIDAKTLKEVIKKYESIIAGGNKINVKSAKDLDIYANDIAMKQKAKYFEKEELISNNYKESVDIENNTLAKHPEGFNDINRLLYHTSNGSQYIDTYTKPFAKDNRYVISVKSNGMFVLSHKSTGREILSTDKSIESLNDYYENLLSDYEYNPDKLDAYIKSWHAKDKVEIYGGKKEKANVESTNGMEGYTIPWNSFTLTMSEDSSKMDKSTTEAKQHGDLIGDAKVQDSYINHTVKPSLEGNAEHNTMFEKYMSGNEQIAKDIDVNQLGMKEKLTILKKGKGKLYNDLIRELLYADNDIEDMKESYYDGVYDDETGVMIRSLLKEQGAAAKILSAVNLTPQTMQLPGVKNYWETMLTKWFMKSAITPKTKYGIKAVLRPHSPFSFNNKPFEQGSYYLAEGYKNKKVKDIDGKEITLEQLYEKYKDSKVKAEQNLLYHNVVRVPADSKAGVRILKFGGFLKGQDGYGIVLHPEDMVNIGGADTDIDTAFVYFDMPEDVKKYYMENKDQWKDPVDGTFTESKTMLNEFKHPEQIEMNSFDPYSLLEVNKMAYEGNQLLGRGLAFSNRLKAIFNYAKSTGDLNVEGYKTETAYDVLKNTKNVEKVFEEYKKLNQTDPIKYPLTDGVPDKKIMTKMMKAESEQAYKDAINTEYERLNKEDSKKYPYVQGKPDKKILNQVEEAYTERLRKTKTGEKQLRWNIELDLSKEKELEQLTREIINFAADSADGIRVKSPEEITNLLLTKVFGEVPVKMRKGNVLIFDDGEEMRFDYLDYGETEIAYVNASDKIRFTNQDGEEITYVPVRANQVDMYNTMAKLDSIIKNRNHDSKTPWGESAKYSIMEIDNSLERYSNNFKDGLPLTSYKSLKELSKYKLSEANSNWRADDVTMDNFLQEIDKMFYTDKKGTSTTLSKLVKAATGRDLHTNSGEGRTKAIEKWKLKNQHLLGKYGEEYFEKLAKSVADEYFRNDILDVASSILSIDRYNRLVGYKDVDKVGLPEYPGINGYNKTDATAIKDIVAFYKKHNDRLKEKDYEDNPTMLGWYIDPATGKVKNNPSVLQPLNQTVLDAFMKEFHDNASGIDISIQKSILGENKKYRFDGRNLNQAEKEYFEALTIGSLKPSRKDYDDATKKAKTDLDNVVKKIKSELPQFKKDKPNQLLDNLTTLTQEGKLTKSKEELKHLDALRNELDKVFRIHGGLVKDWYSTSSSSEYFNKDFISGSIVRDYANMFTEIVKTAMGTVNPVLDKPVIGDKEVDVEFTPDIRNEVEIIQEKVKRAEPLSNLIVDRLAEKQQYNLTVTNEEVKKLSTELTDILVKNPNLINNIQDIYANWAEYMGGMPKTFSDLTLEEYRGFVTTLKEMTTFDKSGLELKKRHWFFLPEHLADIHTKYDNKNTMLINSPVFDARTNKMVVKELRIPVSRMKAHTIIGTQGMRNIEEGIDAGKQFASESNVTKILDGIKDHTDRNLLYDYVQSLRELGMYNEKFPEKNVAYKQEFDRIERIVNESGIKNRKFNISEDGKNKVYTFDEMVEKIKTESTKEFQTIWEDKILGAYIKNGKKIMNFDFIYTGGEEDVLQHHLKQYTASNIIKDYTGPNWINIKKVLSDMGYALSNKRMINNLGTNIKDYIVHMSMIDNITVSGGRENPETGEKKPFKISELKDFKNKVLILNELWDYSREEVIKDEDGKPIFDNEGQLATQVVFPFRSVLEFKPKTEMTQEQYETYFPHMDMPKAEREKKLQEKLVQTEDPEEKAKLRVYFNKEGEAEYLDNIEDILSMHEQGVTIDKMMKVVTRRNQNLLARSTTDPTPGWNKNHSVFSRYVENIEKDYYTSTMALLLHDNANKFAEETYAGKNNIGKEHAKYWEGFMRASIRNMLGFPSNYPAEWLKDPKYKISGNPYHMLTDNYWANKATILDKFFGIDDRMRKLVPKTVEKSRSELIQTLAGKKYSKGLLEIYDLYEITQGLLTNGMANSKSYEDNIVKLDAKIKEYGLAKKDLKSTMEAIKKDIDAIPTEKRLRNATDEQGKTIMVDAYKGIRESMVSRKLASLSNAEGKWNLLTLLSHPKTALTNLIGSFSNTITSTGMEYFRMANNTTALKRIKSDWGDKAVLEADIDKVGGMENYFKYEMGLSQKFNSDNARRFMNKAIEKMKNNPDLPDITIYEIAKQEGLDKAFVDKAAYFIKKSERVARRTSWLAHYLKARSVFEATNSTFDWNDPWLINMANKGVAATQFLYHNAARPEFMRTSIGKMVGRFQMYTIGSVAMRMDITKKAYLMGYKKGTEQYKRLERLATMDVMMLALASVLPFSIFNTTLPAPMNYLQDVAQWLFGNSDDKERAFFGALPYPANIIQPVLPPSSRLLTGTLGMLADGGVEKFLSYQLWTWFPFGRLANDVRKSAANPQFTMERLTGIPYDTMKQNIVKSKKIDEKEKKKKAFEEQSNY